MTGGGNNMSKDQTEPVKRCYFYSVLSPTNRLLLRKILSSSASIILNSCFTCGSSMKTRSSRQSLRLSGRGVNKAADGTDLPCGVGSRGRCGGRCGVVGAGSRGRRRRRRVGDGAVVGGGGGGGAVAGDDGCDGGARCV